MTTVLAYRRLWCGLPFIGDFVETIGTARVDPVLARARVTA
jgi:hypothetical protein